MGVRNGQIGLSGDAYGLVRNADEVVVELVVAIEVFINADGIGPRRQIGFNAQMLRSGGNGKKSATESPYARSPGNPIA